MQANGEGAVDRIRVARGGACYNEGNRN
jgi:hypothetical protein